ncbi:uncharacterized protein LY79DRAFT_654706 [Colletotrichum navitas]|uniref:Uncharacterized protein n=1 Tax=Colletotrichum navitas TaxID=681940 RepID=A0AAD8VCL2_9PEZI|nr:uncharacterized protein LY79DRAFT_654706 [Colletotrichum navitas]KAK1600213.1 hypothetical protein LY79DRAFT_654706 [Colletotrichum navitas]
MQMAARIEATFTYSCLFISFATSWLGNSDPLLINEIAHSKQRFIANALFILGYKSSGIQCFRPSCLLTNFKGTSDVTVTQCSTVVTIFINTFVNLPSLEVLHCLHFDACYSVGQYKSDADHKV